VRIISTWLLGMRYRFRGDLVDVEGVLSRGKGR
jgi:hypothetical protein